MNDNHAGCRSEGKIFFDSAARFYRDVFFPCLDKRGIRTIVHLGDLVDRRKYIAYVTANHLRRELVQPILDRGIEFIITPGNHDLPYRNLVSINAERELLPTHPLVRVVDQPTVWPLYDLPVLLLPWICDENRAVSMDMISRLRGGVRVAMGHLELAGFEFYRGVLSEHGMSASNFAGYDLVCSGHYHQPSARDNIRYLGAPFEMTWHDYDCPRGFHLFDTETLKLEFIPNPHTVFMKDYYDGSNWTEPGHAAWCAKVFGKIVKLVVKDRSDPAHFDRYVEHLESIAASVQVVDDHKHADLISVEEVGAPVSDTLELLQKCVAEVDVKCDREALRQLLVSVYQEAVSMETD